MHWNYWILLALALSLTACASRQRAASNQEFPMQRPPPAPPAQAPASKAGSADIEGSGPARGPTIVTPASARVGRISLVNSSAQYVIVTYAVGQLPVREARLYVYRGGLRVAELKVTSFSRDINAAADILAGECRVGDEVREH